MNNYNIVASTEADKYHIIETIRESGAILTGVSGYGSGYYIQMDATPEQADYINRFLYTEDIHNMTADGIRTAWSAGELTIHQVYTWQQRHGVIMEVTAV